MKNPRMILCQRLTVGMIAIACSLFALARAGAAGIDAEWVFYNGKILTADTDDPGRFSTAQAVAIYDGKFIVVGQNQEALATAGPKTKKIDLQGRTMLPGLIETHLHVHSQTAHHLKDMGFRDWGWTIGPVE